MSKQTKGDLLGKYADKQPKQFVQIDGYCHVPNYGDEIMDPDVDGDCITKQEAWELMHGANVRVLIEPQAAVIDAIRILGKIKDYLQEEINKIPEDGIKTMGEMFDVKEEIVVEELPF